MRGVAVSVGRVCSRPGSSLILALSPPGTPTGWIVTDRSTRVLVVLTREEEEEVSEEVAGVEEEE